MDWTRREDLENKSKEELIDIIMNIQEDLEYFPDKEELIDIIRNIQEDLEYFPDLYDGTYDDYEE